MLKLYKREGDRVTAYHEAWVAGSQIIEHRGVLGERGGSRKHAMVAGESEDDCIRRVLAEPIASGFEPLDDGDHCILLVEYSIAGMGDEKNLAKRHALEDQLNEILGWTGLGHCDGGSIGSVTMEVCCFVVDFETAKRVIAAELADTEFADYARIFVEAAD